MRLLRWQLACTCVMPYERERSPRSARIAARSDRPDEAYAGPARSIANAIAHTTMNCDPRLMSGRIVRARRREARRCRRRAQSQILSREALQMNALLASRRGRLAVAAACLAMLGLVLGAASARAAFNPAVVVSGADLGEPGIDAAADGTLYINATTGLLSNLPGSPSDIFRSDDGGSSWQLLPAGLKANFPGGGDSDISLDPQTGAIAETDLWLGSATVSKSTDKGATWTANPLQGVVVQDRQWVAQAV